MVGKFGLEPEDQDYPFSQDTVNKLVKYGYTNKDFEHPYFDEHKEKLAGFGEFTDAELDAMEEAEDQARLQMIHESPSQEAQVWAYLKEHGSITDRVARDKLYIHRLAARIHNLRHRDGYNIGTHMITRKYLRRRTKRYALYYIKNN
tara:strand:- start:40 stop:480 length:441 start_codon:yes stop_codon:yes gene_type:complete